MYLLSTIQDSVTYEGSDQPIYTFTILTTSSSPRLSFLHQRMPVLLRSTSDMLEWLNCSKEEWRSSLARLLKPFGKDDSDLLWFVDSLALHVHPLSPLISIHAQRIFD
jgi:putative SOS response-associated peptidase YedK